MTDAIQGDFSHRGRTPKRIQVGPLSYTIVFQSELLYDRNRWGECSHRRQEIRLFELMPDDHVPVTFLHEARHSIAQLYDVGPLKDDTGEEAPSVTERLARGLLAFLRDNPEVVAWLRERPS